MSDYRFDAVLIDFYGTICGGDREAVETTCARIVRECGLPISSGDFAIRWGERFFAAIDQSNRDAFKTLYECEISSLRVTLNEFGDSSDPAPFVADLEAYWRDPPIYQDAVDFLRQVDLPVCCVSNADTIPLQTAIEKHGLSFDGVVCSESARSYKPDARIFRIATDKLGVQPNRVAHIGDSIHSDVRGANEVGITSVWVHRMSRIHDIADKRECQPQFTICTLSEIRALFSV